MAKLLGVAALTAAWYLCLHPVDNHAAGAVVAREDLGDGSPKAIKRLMQLEAIEPTDAPEIVEEDDEDLIEANAADEVATLENRVKDLENGLPEDSPAILEELKTWKVGDLRKIASDLDIPATGTKEEILGLLKDADPVLLSEAYLAATAA